MAILETLATVTGWLSGNEAAWLNLHAAQVTEGCIVEIGSYQGKSTIALALNAAVPVYAIDPHHNHTDEIGAVFGPADRAAFHNNIVQAGVQKRVCPVNLTSDHAAQGWQERIGLLFIDGAHNYLQVDRDVYNWLPYILPDGVLAIHDRAWPDIADVLHRLNGNRGLRRYAICDSIQAYRKLPCSD